MSIPAKKLKSLPFLSIHRKINRIDPTRTLTLRNNFSRDMEGRFNKLVQVIKKSVIDNDCFGLLPPGAHIKRIRVHAELNPAENRMFDFPRSADKVKAFIDWLQEQEKAGILQVSEMPRLGGAIEEAWIDKYLEDSYERGVQRARYDMKREGMQIPSIEESGGIKVTMSTPLHMDRLGVVYTRAFQDLKGITAAMDTQISRVLAQGIADGDNPEVIARKLNKVITGMGEDLGITDTLGRFIPAKRRAKMLARTEIIRAHAQAQLQEMKNWGVAGVTAEVEFVTAGYNVCPICEGMEGQVYTIEDAMNIIPVHPNCRCAWKPIIITDKTSIPPKPIKKVPEEPQAEVYPSLIPSDLIKAFPEVTNRDEYIKKITPEMLMNQAKWDDIKKQMNADLHAIRIKHPVFEKPSDVKAIIRNMKAEFESYHGYLAGDTSGLVMSIINDYSSMLNPLIEADKLKLDDLNRLGIDIVRKLMFQEIESNRRQFTDHGIRHITNDWKMADRILTILGSEKDVPSISSMDRLEVLFTLVNHDIGYDTAVIRAGGVRGIFASGGIPGFPGHKDFSEAILKEQKDIWNIGIIFKEKNWSHLLDVVRTHDSYDMSIRDGKLTDPLLTSVRIADNLSQFWSEKLPSMFRYVPGSEEILVKMMEASRSNDKGVFEGLRGQLRNLVDTSHLSDALKRDLMAGVDDINYMTPKYSLPTLAGEVSRVFGSKEAAIVIEIQHNELDAFLQQMFDLGQKRVKSLLEDLGFKDFTEPSYKIGKLADGKAFLELRVINAPENKTVDSMIEWSIPNIKEIDTVVHPFKLEREGKIVGNMSVDWVKELRDYATKNNISIEEAEERLENQLQRLTSDSHVWVRQQSSALDDIIASKGMLNQYDVGRSTVAYDPIGRRQLEAGLWGAPEKLSSSHRPIYGYLASDPNGIGSWWVEAGRPGSSHYGEVSFRLKDSVKPRTTFLIGDSLNDYHMFETFGYKAAPSPLNQPDLATVPDFLFKNIDKMKTVDDFNRIGYGAFFESQIWGGVKIKDVEEIVFYNKSIYEKYKNAFEGMGIKCKYVPEPKMPSGVKVMAI